MNVEETICSLEWCRKWLHGLNNLSKEIHLQNRKWWCDPATGKRVIRNKGEMLMLIVSEIAECMEGVRKNTADSHIPYRRAEEVELADAVIRILDYAAGHNLDLQGAILEKLRYNTTREDHSVAARLAPGGKKF